MAINEEPAKGVNDEQSKSEKVPKSDEIPKPEARKETTPENQRTGIDEFEIRRKSFFGL